MNAARARAVNPIRARRGYDKLELSLCSVWQMGNGINIIQSGTRPTRQGSNQLEVRCGRPAFRFFACAMSYATLGTRPGLLVLESIQIDRPRVPQGFIAIAQPT